MATPLMPAFAKLRTTAPPMPPAPPVINATRPASSISSLRSVKVSASNFLCLIGAAQLRRFLLVDGPTFRQLNQVIGLAGISHRDAVRFLRFFRRNIAFDHIPANFLDVAFERLTVTTAPRQIDVNDFAAAQVLQCLGVQSRSIVEQDFAGRARLAAEQSRRRIRRTIRNRAHTPTPLAAACEFSQLPQATAPFAGATRISTKLAPLHHHWRQALDH